MQWHKNGSNGSQQSSIASSMNMVALNERFASIKEGIFLDQQRKY
jgi:hypothetical protein